MEKAIILFTGISFIIYGVNSFYSRRMISEFKRWGYKKHRKTISSLQILGGLGLLIGLKINILLIASSLCLSIMMFVAIIVRVGINDNVARILPAITYLMLSSLIFNYSCCNRLSKFVLNNIQNVKIFTTCFNWDYFRLIIYQSAMIAPSINKLLSTQDASTYLRFIWPKFFLIIAFLSIVGGVIIFSNQDQSFAKIVFIVSSVLMLICFFAVPFMNDARDSGKQNLFFIQIIGSMIYHIDCL